MTTARGETAGRVRSWIATARWWALGIPALVGSAACSLILSPGDLDAQYGRDGGGASSAHGSTSSGLGGDAGGRDAGCVCGGGCADGRCVPKMLLAKKPDGIACSANGVYAVGNGIGLKQFPKDGQMCDCLNLSDPGAVPEGFEVAVGSGQVVWRTVAGTVYSFWSLPDASCCPARRASKLVVTQTTTTSTSLDFGNGLATDGTSLFWLDAAAVKQAPLAAPDGGGTGKVIANAASGPDGLAITPDSLFYNQYNNGTTFATNPYDGGGARQWADGNRCRGVQTNGTVAAWAALATPSTGMGQIHTALVEDTSGVAANISDGFGQPSGLAIDESYVYVADSQLGTVSRVAIAAPHAVDVLWSEAGSKPLDVCVDDTYVYWLTMAMGEGLMRVEKSPP